MNPSALPVDLVRVLVPLVDKPPDPSQVPSVPQLDAC